jgi:3-oxoacyl-[acyl-carrier-protein] synthase-3
MTIKITGTGSALPEKQVWNTDLEKMMDTSDEWIRERTGIGSRYISTGETLVELAGRAAQNALENAGCGAEEIELLLVATCSPETNIPSVACQVQSMIGAQNAVAMDLNAACAGFLFALHTAYAYAEAGVYKKALIIGAELLSKIVDWNDRGTCILFGDGAGAAVVEKTSEGGLLGFVQHADGKKGEVLRCDTRELKNPFVSRSMESPYIQMDGREVFAFAVRQVPAGILEVLAKTGRQVEDVDLFVLHQANKRIIEGISKRLGVPLERFPINLDRVGNMSSAAIPVLLDELNRQGALKKGMTIVLSGFGAGLTWGASVLEW